MTKLTHKVRNPKKLDTWLDIWTADNITIDDNNTINYIITPSDKWKIPITQLSEADSNGLIPMNYINNGGNIVTTTNPENTTGGLAYFDRYNVVKTIDADRGLSFNKDKTTIGHSNDKLTTGGTVGQQSDNNTNQGSSPSIPYIEYDKYGHITSASTIVYTVNDLTIENLSKDGFTPAKGEGQNAIPGKNFSETVVDIIGKNINNLLPINSADNNGIVKAVKDNSEDESHANTVWASNGDSEPAWRKITNDMISGDEDEKISGDKITQNSATSSGVIPPSGSSGPQFWGVPSNGDSPKWSSMTLSPDSLPINYDKNTSTLKIGINDQQWNTPSNEDENSTDSETPSSWSKYIAKSVSYYLS